MRATCLALASATSLLLIAFISYQLALARVPAQRVALEELVRHESGLDLTFNTLTVHWGWYGPEAVFEGVALNEPGSAQRLLTAARLRVSLDPWSLTRSGQLEASRIMFDEPDFDLTPALAYPAAVNAPKVRASLMQAAARMLSGWHSGEIEMRDARVRTQQGGHSVVFAIRYAQLWHHAREWQGSAQLALPQSLGATASLALRMHGDPALPEIATGTLQVEARRVLLGAWRALLPQTAATRYLPHSGRGNLAFTVAFAHGRLTSAEGSLRAARIAWQLTDDGGATQTFGLERVAGRFSLAREGAAWRLRAPALQLTGGRAPATLTVAIAADGSSARGVLMHLPLAGLGLTAGPQQSLAFPVPAGEARAFGFDWSVRRPAGARLLYAAQLRDLMFEDAAHDVTLAGLSGQAFGTEADLSAELSAAAARLMVGGTRGRSIDALAVRSHLRVSRAPQGWQLSADALEFHRADMLLSARGHISIPHDAPASIDAHLSVSNADAALLAGLLQLPARIAAGRIDHAEAAWRGPLDAPPWGEDAQFTGNAAVSGLRTVGTPSWPQVDGIDTRLVWHGARGHADIEHAQSGRLQLSTASADWDARGGHGLRFDGTLAGEAGEALTWLRAHPELAVWAPAVSALDLHGAVRANLQVTVADLQPTRVRIAAQLEDGSLDAVAGLPPIEALRGALRFDGEHLQRSVLAGRWLGGPVNLTVSEQRTQGGSQLAILGRGFLDAQHTLLAAGGDRDAALGGSAEWSARLTFFPGAAGTRWYLRADSTLAGVTSQLPEPFAKSAAAAMPLHVELTGDGATGQLRLALGERVHAAAALARDADSWRIERGALALGGFATLPEDQVVAIDGSLGRLDLASALALLRAAGADAALPALRVRLYTGALVAGTRNFGAATLAAHVAAGGGQLQLTCDALSGSASWPQRIDREHPARLRLAAFAVGNATDLMFPAGVAALFGPAAQLSVDVLSVAGRPVGAASALLTWQDDVLEVHSLGLAGTRAAAEGQARCDAAACRLDFILTSPDAAAVLEAFGLRPELDAGRARLSGELTWSARATLPLATLGGHLHMQLENGATRPGEAAEGEPFGLLAVPALLAAAESGEGQDEPLRFARLVADYDIADGVARTRNLHFDGDAEILVRGAVGLAADDYDLEAWILRGADRLPAAVRELAATPRVAAAWLSLRNLLGGVESPRTRQALRLRGSWNDPIVSPAE